MRLTVSAILWLATTCFVVAQAPSASSSPIAPPSFAVDLDRLQSAASEANLQISHFRIDKWKADSGSKQQAQANAESLQRNLSSALPGLIAEFRAAPQDLNAGFKLYRNLNALYDVLVSFTESTGAFGSKNDYDALAQQLSVIDSVRHDLGNNIEALTASSQSELNQLRAQVRTLQQAAAAAPPKKVVIDDTEPPKKTSTHKKKATTATGQSGSSSATSSSGSTSKSQSDTPGPSAKSD